MSERGSDRLEVLSELAVRDAAGNETGRTVDLPAAVFGAQVNVALIHQVVVAQQAAARQGTAETRGRGAVRGGGRKPHRQKGTGRARQGSVRAPHYTGGGIVHGPTPREYTQRTPKRMKAAALAGALSDRARADRVHVVEALVSGDEPSTKDVVTALGALTDRRPVLVVAADDLTLRSVRNVPDVHALTPGQLNTYDVLVADDVVFVEAAFEAFSAGPVAARLAGKPPVAVEDEEQEEEVA